MENEILLIPPWISLHNEVAKLVVTVLLWCSDCCDSYTLSLSDHQWDQSFSIRLEKLRK